MSMTSAAVNIVAFALAGAAYTPYNNLNAYIGVGDSTTAFALGQTDLQATTNKVRVGMDASFPTVAGTLITFQSTFGAAVGNFAWQEWGVFNASSGGTMLSRKVESLGTKVAGQTWVFQAQLTLSTP